MTEQIERVIASGKPLAVIQKLVKAEYERLDRAAFDTAMREEYDALFPEFREMTYQEYLVSELDEEPVSEDTFASEFRVDTRVEIDYSEDETYKTYEEYANETRVVSEKWVVLDTPTFDNLYDKMSTSLDDSYPSEANIATVEEELQKILDDIANGTDNSSYTDYYCDVEEVTELVRPYVANDITDKVDDYCNGLYAELRAKEYPKLEDFADAWVKDDTDGMEAYKQACLAVKAKYPKA